MTAILCYGIPVGDNPPWLAYDDLADWWIRGIHKREWKDRGYLLVRLHTTDVQYGDSLDYPYHILAVPNSVQEYTAGYTTRPKEVRLDLSEEEGIEPFLNWCEEYGIKGRPSWYLVEWPDG